MTAIDSGHISHIEGTAKEIKEEAGNTRGAFPTENLSKIRYIRLSAELWVYVPQITVQRPFVCR